MAREQISKGETVYRDNLPVVVHEVLGGDLFVVKFGEGFQQRETVTRAALETFREINDRKDAEEAERKALEKPQRNPFSQPR